MNDQPDIWEELAAIEAEPPAELLDRTPVERYITCPFQGAAIETGLVTSGGLAADSGNEAHDAFAAMLTDYIVSDGQASLSDLTTTAIGQAQMSRPDIQPDVLDAVRAGVWQIARDLMYRPDGQRRNPADILRYQGGQGERTGQIAYDLVAGGPGKAAIRLTTELDLLMAGDARDELCVTDWKTGRTSWTAAKVRAAFQFQFQSMLIFETYPDCHRVWVRVWSPRTGGATGWVGFTRRDAADVEARCSVAVEGRRIALSDPEHAVCTPDAERCSRCDAAGICPFAASPAPRLSADPEAFLANFAIRQLQLDKDEKAMKAYVKARGPIVGNGWKYGPKRPSNQQPACALSEVKGDDKPAKK